MPQHPALFAAPNAAIFMIIFKNDTFFAMRIKTESK
jgi:hypothetical protein